MKRAVLLRGEREPWLLLRLALSVRVSGWMDGWMMLVDNAILCFW